MGFTQEDVDRMIQEAASAAKEKSSESLEKINGTKDSADAKKAAQKQKAADETQKAAPKVAVTEPSPEDLADEILQDVSNPITDEVTDEELSEVIQNNAAQAQAADNAEELSDESVDDDIQDNHDIADQQTDDIEEFEAPAHEEEPEECFDAVTPVDDHVITESDHDMLSSPPDFDDAFDGYDEYPAQSIQTQSKSSAGHADVAQIEAFVMETIEELAQARIELARMKVELEIEKMRSKARGLF